MNMESPESPSPPPPPPSFSSLPNDIALNIFARISRIQYPTLSLVCKSFRDILSCRDLYVTRTLISKTEDFLYVYLNLNHKNPDLRWFALSLVPNRQKLIPMPSFPYAKDSTVLSTGSEIYIIGGFSKEGERSKRVFVMDTRSQQWRRLPDMSFPRRYPPADVIDDKLYVIDVTGKIWGEVYNPKTQTWTRFIKNTIDLTFQKSVRFEVNKFTRGQEVAL